MTLQKRNECEDQGPSPVGLRDFARFQSAANRAMQSGKVSRAAYFARLAALLKRQQMAGMEGSNGD